MNIERIWASVLLIACGLFSGCSVLSSDGSRASTSKVAAERPEQALVSPAFRAENHHQWVKRLKFASPAESLEGRVPSASTAVSLPIPLPQTSLEQYALVVDESQQLAWLQGSDHYGPFALSNPDVAHLMNSVAAGFQEQVAWQASQQQTAFQQAAAQYSANQFSQQTQASVSPEFQLSSEAGVSSVADLAPPANQNPFDSITPPQQVAQPQQAAQPQQQSSYASEFDHL